MTYVIKDLNSNSYLYKHLYYKVNYFTPKISGAYLYLSKKKAEKYIEFSKDSFDIQDKNLTIVKVKIQELEE
ncbi:MAG: hypothetical protein MUF43_06695 [Flavobacterium sp.]|nr:hypothetical protein [Flavobacterium sp.]